MPKRTGNHFNALKHGAFSKIAILPAKTNENLHDCLLP